VSTPNPFIPFVRSNSDDELARELYGDACIWRVMLERDGTAKSVPPGCLLWIDLGFDGVQRAFDFASMDWGKPWLTFINRHGDLSTLADPAFIAKPVARVIEKPIISALDEASGYAPAYISIPQLPHTDDAAHNKINKLLFQITVDWHQTRRCAAKLVLPAVFTHCRQLNKKTDRNSKIKFLAGLLGSSNVSAIWSVDSSLEDQSGVGNLARERFPGIVEFFRELKAAAHLDLVIAGPYWGLGLVLWARGLATHFGVGIGSTYRYPLPGGRANPPRTRIAPECLRRWVTATPELRDWLTKSASKLPSGSTEQAELTRLASNLTSLLSVKVSKRQVARAHRNWCQKIAATAAAGRGVALFQDLSTAFVTGKALDPLPDEDGPLRRPELVAEQLMLNFL